MKRSKIYFGILLLFTVILLSGCKKKEEKTVSCEDLYTNYVNATTTFLTTPTEATCVAFEEAVQAYLNGCAILTPTEKQDLQDALEDNDCSVYN